jgi:hypothetical protein
MSTPQPLNAHYELTVQVQIEGLSAPLAISANSVNELRRAIRLLRENDMLAEQQPIPSTSNEPPICTVHNRAMKPSKKPGAWYCSARVGEGYCDQKVG